MHGSRADMQRTKRRLSSVNRIQAHIMWIRTIPTSGKELGGCPDKGLAKFIRDEAKKAGQLFNISEEEPRIHRSQFAYKWKCRIVLAFMKTQAQQMLQLQRRIVRTKLQRNNIPIVHDE